MRATHVLQCLEITFLHLRKLQLTLFVPTAKEKESSVSYTRTENPSVTPDPRFWKDPHASLQDRAKALGRTPSPRPPVLTPPQEPPQEVLTCDGHVADALLVNGGHQDHGLRRHHHGGRQGLQHIKAITGSQQTPAHTNPSLAAPPTVSWG